VTTKVGKMAQKVLEKGHHGEEFQRDFVMRIILTCVIRCMNGDYFFRILTLLMDVT